MIRSILVIFIVSLVVAGCGSSPISLEGFDVSSWRNDNYGCSGQRITQLALIRKQKEQLLGKTQNDIKDYLGAPDEHELYERTRKFFYYYLEPSDKCDGESGSQPRILQIRFSAMGIANEVFVRNE
ncbi:MAG: hypothetical protein WBA74_01990 [Cyclobacteriaceae bacterium]